MCVSVRMRIRMRRLIVSCGSLVGAWAKPSWTIRDEVAKGLSVMEARFTYHVGSFNICTKGLVVDGHYDNAVTNQSGAFSRSISTVDMSKASMRSSTRIRPPRLPVNLLYSSETLAKFHPMSRLKHPITVPVLCLPIPQHTSKG